jgi:hypothetical protein
MKIKVKKDKNGYFAQFIDNPSIRAVGDTPVEAINFLHENYRIFHEKDKTPKTNFSLDLKKLKTIFDSISFKSIQIVL